MKKEWGFEQIISLETFKDVHNGYVVNDSHLSIGPNGQLSRDGKSLAMFLMMEHSKESTTYVEFCLRVIDQLNSKHKEYKDIEMGNREEVVEVDSFNSPVGNYVATYGTLALALIALSISALVSIPGGYSNNNACFKEMPSFKLYHIASFVCFTSSTASLLILFLLKFNTHDGAKKFLKFLSISFIHVSVVSLVVVATAIEFLIDGSYSFLIGIGPASGILLGIIVYHLWNHLWNWLVRMAGLKNATVWVFHMLKNATICVYYSLKNATLWVLNKLKNATFWIWNKLKKNAVRAEASYERWE
ncbi:hypothetical protein CsatA_009076 [Cannabis sativa]